MKIANFYAESDLVGGRIRIGWDFLLEGGETLAQVPHVVLRRKLRDFAFPAPMPPAGMTAYDSAPFPPPGVTVLEAPGWEERTDAYRHVTTVETGIAVVGGSQTEVIRRTITNTFDRNNLPLRQHIEILDTGYQINPDQPEERLTPGRVYYYQLFCPVIIDPDDDPAPYRGAATATGTYQSGQLLYEQLPNVYRRHDVRTRPAIAGTAYIPEAESRGGQLRRFIDLFGVGLDSMRSTADALVGLHDADHVDSRFLMLLAQWIGWGLSFDSAIPAQRMEIKSAPAIYRGIGTIPNLRALVNYYTGWYSQIAEFVQNIARANQPPQLNIYALRRSASGWRSADDAAVALGFEPGNDLATGAGLNPAMLTSTVSGPFALAPGMRLVLSVDNQLPVTLQFWPGDVGDIRHADATDLAEIINRELHGLSAQALPDGRLRMLTNKTGLDAALHIRPCPEQIVALESTPAGRLSTVTDAQGRLHLFYEVAPDFPPDPEPTLTTSIRYKTLHQGAWRNSQAFPLTPEISQGSPAATLLPSDQIRLSWIEHPHTPQARIRTTVGSLRPPKPAILVGQKAEPFNIPVATSARLAFRLNHITVFHIDFLNTDFADPTNATAAEVVTALNARVPQLASSIQPNRTILIKTTGADAEHLQIDLAASTCAVQLGFTRRNVVALGDWSSELDWAAAETVATVTPGRHADLSALRDANGDDWLFWAIHTPVAGNSIHAWHIAAIRNSGVGWSAVDLRTSGLNSHREPVAILDSNGDIWLFYAQETIPGSPAGDWTLRARVFDRATASWGAEQAITALPASGHAADREPGALRLPDGTLRVYFRTDRGGGDELWSVTIDPTGPVIGAPEAVTESTAAYTAPAPVIGPDGGEWLLCRGDRPVPLSQMFTLPSVYDDPDWQPERNRALRLADTGTLHHFNGSTTVILNDLRRNENTRRWDDLLTYTPERVETLNYGGVLVDQKFYTPNTIGIYVSRTAEQSILTQHKVERLRQVLEQVLPINIRAVIILAPRVDTEYVYEAGMDDDIQESYQDDYPFIEYYAGLDDDVAAALPDWIVLLTNRAAHVSGDSSDLTTLRRKTYFPPPL